MSDSARPMIIRHSVNQYAAPVLLGLLSALAIMAVGSVSIILMLAGVVAVVLSMVSARFGIAVLISLSALFFRSELFIFSLPFFGGGLKPTDILLAAIMGGWVFRSLLKQHWPEVPRRITAIVLAFISWSGVAVLIGLANGAFYKYSLVEFRPLLHFLLILPIASEFTAKDVEKIIIVIIAVSVAVSFKAMYLYSQGIGETATYAEGVIRVTTIEFLYLVASALGSIAIFLHRKRFIPILLAIFYLNLAALAVTFQRAAWIALVISIFFLFAVNRDFRRGFLLAGILAGSGLLIIAAMSLSPGQSFRASVQERMFSVSNYETDVSALHRFEEWKASLTMIRNHPIIGNGLGSRVYFYSPMHLEGKKRPGYLSDDFYVHNSFIWIAVKTGAIGAILFLVFLMSIYRDALKFLARSPPGEQRYILSLLISIIAAITFSSIFGPMLTSDLLTPLVAFAAGSIYAVNREFKQEIA